MNDHFIENGRSLEPIFWAHDLRSYQDIGDKFAQTFKGLKLNEPESYDSDQLEKHNKSRWNKI